MMTGPTKLVLPVLILCGAACRPPVVPGGGADPGLARARQAFATAPARAKVVFVGEGFVEALEDTGEIDLAFARHRTAPPLFLWNLGWAGDDPSGAAREGGRDALVAEVKRLAPHVVVVGYGANAAAGQTAAVPAFRTQLATLARTLAAMAPHVVLLTPPTVPAPLPARAAVIDAIRAVARDGGYGLVDLDGLYRLAPSGLAPDAPRDARDESLRRAFVERAATIRYRTRPLNVHPRHAKFFMDSLARFDEIIARQEDVILALRASAPQPPQIQRPRAGVARGGDAPADEQASFSVAPGFAVNLFADEPAVVNPIHMNFDPQGRLWVACSPTYPHLYPGQEARDYIVVLEDRDHDGRAERSTVFADGLLLPTGIAPGDGGVYVGEGSTLVHYADTDGDLKADRRRVLARGFGTQDVHHDLNSFRWGPTGELFFHQGIYIRSHVETAFGLRHLVGGGVWRFDPRTSGLEVHDQTLAESNTWGHAFDAWGQAFVTNAWDNGIYALTPPLGVAADPSLRKLLRVGDGRHCGADFVDGAHLSDDWQGNLLTGQFVKQQVSRFIVSDAGATFNAEEAAPLLTSSHPAFRPIDVKQGPDGAIYVADLYTPIIQHNQIDFADPRRDHTHGRIWRLQRNDRPLIQGAAPAGKDTNAVVAQLGARESWTRTQARRVLAERPRDEVLRSLGRWIGTVDGHNPGADRVRLEALWVYASHDEPAPELLRRTLDAGEPRARAAAARLVGRWPARVPWALAALTARTDDEDPRVRLAAVLSLGALASADAATAAFRVLAHPTDPLLDRALDATVARLAPVWYPAFAAGRFDFGGNIDHLARALAVAGTPGAAAPVRARLARPLPETARRKLVVLLARLGGPDDLRVVLDRALGSSDPDETRALLGALEEASAQRRVRPAGALDQVALLVGARDSGVREAALQLGESWGVAAIRVPAAAIAADPASSPPLRAAALRVLARAPDGADSLASLAAPGHTGAVRGAAIAALAALAPDRAAPVAADFLAVDVPPEADPAAIFRAFLRRKEGPAAIAAAMERRRPAQDMAKIGLRTLAGAGAAPEALMERLADAAGLTQTEQAPTADTVRRAVADARQRGEAARGELVFRRPELACRSCHAIDGVGGYLGPDLGALGRSAPVDYIVESILNPPKAVKDGYESLQVTTRDGTVYNGIKVRQTRDAMILKDASSEAIPVPLSSVQSVRPTGSLMPPGLAASLTQAELADLVRFLAALGKEPAFSGTPAPAVRAWQALETVPPAWRAADARTIGAALARPDLIWTSVYSRVSGALPLDDVRPAGSPARLFLRFTFDAEIPGAVIVALEGADVAALWIDGTPVAGRTVEVDRGPHAVVLALDGAGATRSLRGAVRPAVASRARVRLRTR